jgi:hypothetical protein
MDKTRKKENNPEDLKIKINAPLIFGGTATVHFLAIDAGMYMVLFSFSGFILGIW